MILDELEEVLRSRRAADPGDSYTARLLADGEFVQRKIMEEAFEVCLELGRPRVDATATAQEAADLLYHLMVGLVSVDVPWSDVVDVLRERRT